MENDEPLHTKIERFVKRLMKRALMIEDRKKEQSKNEKSFLERSADIHSFLHFFILCVVKKMLLKAISSRQKEMKKSLENEESSPQAKPVHSVTHHDGFFYSAKGIPPVFSPDGANKL